MTPETALSWRLTPTRTLDTGGVRFAYRDLGAPSGVPIVLLPHFTAVLDDWDPRVVDALAARRRVIAFDNRGLGGSSGHVPATVAAMAQDAATFIRALGLEQVDLLGFSLGGFIAQKIAIEQPLLVRRLVLAGTGPAGGNDGAARLGRAMLGALVRSARSRRHPKQYLFFPLTPAGQDAGRQYIDRLAERTDDRVRPASPRAALTQLLAITRYRTGPPDDLSEVTQPTLVANGDDDVMLATTYSRELADRLPDATLQIYPAAGHGGVFQHHEQFVTAVEALLGDQAAGRPGATAAMRRRATAAATAGA